MKWRNLPRRYTSRLETLRGQKPHEVLQVPETATITEIKTAYRKLVKIYHPDRSHEFVQASNGEVVTIINDAYAKLVAMRGGEA